jgi:hypothetical protein
MQWLRYCATNQMFACSIPDGVMEFFIVINSSDRIMTLGSTQPLTEMSKQSKPVTGLVWPIGWVEVQIYSSMSSALT